MDKKNIERRWAIDLAEAKKYLQEEEYIWYVTSLRERWSIDYKYNEQQRDYTIARSKALYEKVEKLKEQQKSTSEGTTNQVASPPLTTPEPTNTTVADPEYNMGASSRAGTAPKYPENPNRGETTDCRAPPGFYEKPTRTQKPPRQDFSGQETNLLRGIARTKEEAEKADPATEADALQCVALLCEKLGWHPEALTYWRRFFQLCDNEAQAKVQRKINDLEAEGEIACWDELGPQPGASEIDIIKAYKRRALETHPDKAEPGDGRRLMEYRFKRANIARNLCLEYEEDDVRPPDDAKAPEE